MSVWRIAAAIALEVRDPWKTSMAVADAASAGDRLGTLCALRDRLAADIDAAPPAVTAQLASQLMKVLAEIEALDKGTQRSKLDELAAKRKDRLTKAGVGEPASRKARQRRTGSD